MNARYLLATLAILVAMAMTLTLTSRSTLSPERGADHVFYGPSLEGGAFVGQEIATGNFNGDLYDDFVSAIRWDDPDCGGWDYMSWTQTQACNLGWTSFKAALAGDTVTVCRFPDPDQANHWSAWECLGWDSIPGTAATCAACSTAEYKAENTGAVYVLMGGDWSAKPHDTDLTVSGAGGADHMILGGVPHGDIDNALAAGDMNPGVGGGEDELAIGAPGVAGNGAVYVIQGAASWPSVIDLGDAGDFGDHVRHYLVGRDAGDGFGFGLAMGDLDGDASGIAEVVVVAREGDGPDADSRPGCGEVYVLFGDDLPDTLDLSGVSDDSLQASNHVAVIYGPAENARIGATHVFSCHPVHPGSTAPHQGHYNPVGVAIGDWDGDGRNDLAIGGGQVAGGDEDGEIPGDGAVWVIFGRDSEDLGNKLKPGNIIDLANDPDPNDVNAPDVRITGKTGSALGAGVAFVDADGQGLYDPVTNPNAKADLIIGAPEADDERGEAYIIFGDSRGNLTGSGLDDRSMDDSSHYDVIVHGESVANESCGSDYGYGDQLGGHFSGNRDFDGDGKNDVGISGQEENYVFFIQSRSDWPDSLDLTTVYETHPEMRVVEFVGTRPASSSTISLLDLDSEDGHDLVFGGYDIENRSDAPHAGQMWVWKGDDVWKSGTVSSNTTWSGSVFVNGDVVVDDGATLTIDAGTDVWIWPADGLKNGLGYDTTSVEILVDGELVVNGTLSKPVRFLAWDADSTDTNYNAKWYGIFVRDQYTTATATIQNCIIMNAVRAIQARSPVTIQTVSISNCLLRGVSIAGSNATDVVIDNVNVYDSEIGYRFADGAEATMTNCTASGSSAYGIRIASGSNVSVTGGSVGSSDIGAYVSCDGSPCVTAAVFDGTTFLASDSVAVYVEGYVGGGVMNSSILAATEGIYLDAVGPAFAIDDNLIAVVDGYGVTCDPYIGFIFGNTMYDCATAIWCDDGSVAEVRNNSIKNNGAGVVALNDSEPDLGYGCSPTACADTTCATEGGNSFKNNTYNVINLSTGVTIMAECNYWKKGLFSGAVDRTPAMSSDPLPGAPARSVRLPTTYDLSPNYPNPFNPVTTVRYQIPSPGLVSIRVYDVAGRLVRTLMNRNQPVGYYTVTWDGTTDRGQPVASGVYFLQMKASSFVESRKLLLLK